MFKLFTAIEIAIEIACGFEVDEIVDAIRQLDKGFVLLDELLDKGYMNARKYTWDKSADELYNVLRKYS